MSDWFVYCPPTLQDWIGGYCDRAFREPEGGTITIEIRDDLPIDRIFITKGPVWPLTPCQAFGYPEVPSDRSDAS